MTATQTPPPPAPPAELVPRPVRGGLARVVGIVAMVLVLGFAAGASWLVIIGSLSLMIYLHELGHYLTARRAGMKVTEFFLGFGPRIWSFRRGETEYGIKAIPAGAYVKVIGMYAIEPVAAEDEGRTYRQKNWRQRVTMAVAGSTMHFLVALALIFTLLVTAGAPIGGHLFSAVDETRWEVGRVSGSSAAEQAGLAPGDKLVSVNGAPVTTFAELRSVVPGLLGQEVEVTYTRDGQLVHSRATITEQTDPARKGQGMLGVVPRVETERVNPLVAVPVTVREFGSVVVTSVQGMGRLFTPAGLSSFFRQVAQGGEETKPAAGNTTAPPPSEDNNRLISIYGAARIGVDLLESGVSAYLFLLIVLNVFIGMFNLVPLLPLDGGHIAVATYERLRELRRGDGRRYFVDVTKLMPLTYAVVGVMLLIGVSSLYLDIVNPVTVP